MPFVPHTPESVLPRSDSRNPATTCRGITSTGRPCRRALSKQAAASPGSGSSSAGTLPENAGFCWQHTDQRGKHNEHWRRDTDNDAVKVPRRQSSLDSIVERLGLRHTRRSTKGSTRQQEGGKSRHTRPLQSESLLSLFCCFGWTVNAQEEPLPRIRPQMVDQSSRIHAHHQGHKGAADGDATLPPLARKQVSAATNTSTSHVRVGVPPLRSTCLEAYGRPRLPRGSSSHTQTLLSLIPNSLTPQTTSQLLAELAKPFASTDEAGYIYMFWLRDSAHGTEPVARSALSALAPDASPAAGRRKSSGAVEAPISQNKHVPRGTGETQKMLLKIGRASNVQRRMNEWTSQCGYNPSVVRFYPHIPSQTCGFPLIPSRDSLSPGTPSPTLSPRKVPHAHRVERLIHLELADKRVKSVCQSCGKEHREWFAVDASREAVKAVDHVIRRWVNWGESAA